MDNAGGGQRGLRATPSPQLLQILSEAYRIEATAPPVDLGGSSSLNLLISAASGRFVLRVYRPYITPARLDAIHLVRETLAAHGIPCPQPIQTRDGESWVKLDGRLIEVEAYVEHDGYMNNWARLESALPTLGQIHSLLATLEVGSEGRRPLFANHIEPQDAYTKTLHGTRRMRGWNGPSDQQALVAAAEELAHELASAEETIAEIVPRQLVHGDFWDNNVGFQDKKMVFVADFDFMGERARIDDLALTLYFTCLRYPEKLVTDGLLANLRRLVDAYESGLSTPLSGTERAGLPLAMARQPLWSIGGWVALLDDEASARQHAAGMHWKVDWALQIVHDLTRWQAALA